MTRDKQPEALRLADEIEALRADAAAELRRLHAENEALRAALAEPTVKESLTVEALEEVRDLVLGANFSASRYPKFHAVIDAARSKT
jgi:hypothetical protein